MNGTRVISPQATTPSPPPPVVAQASRVCGESSEAPPGPQLHQDGSLRYPGRGALPRRNSAAKDVPLSSSERRLVDLTQQRGASGEVPARRGRQETTPQQRRQDGGKLAKSRQEGAGKSEEPTWRASTTHANGGTGGALLDAEQASVANTVRDGREEAISVDAPPGTLSASNADRKTRKDFRSREPSGMLRQGSNIGAVAHYGKSKDPRITVGRGGVMTRHPSDRDVDATSQDFLRSEIARLEAALSERDQLQTTQRIPQQPVVPLVAKDTSDCEAATATEDDDSIRRRLDQVVAELDRVTADNLRLEAENRRLGDDALKRAQDFRSERERWREEREALLIEKRRQDKAEENLRRQLASVQKRLDDTLGKETEREQERRQLKSQVQALEKEKSKAEFDTREAELQEKNEQLEMQVQHAREENNCLRHHLHRLEGERTQAYARLAAERSHPRGRGRTILHGGRGNGPSIGLGRRGLPAGRGSGSLPSGGSHISPFGGTSSTIVNSRVPISCLPSLNLDRLRPPEETESALPRSARSASTSSTTSSSDLSSDGSSSIATATRNSDCTRIGHAVFGDAPLQKIPDVGWYVQLRIITVCCGWVGGFGIGVTLSTPTALATLPDRASRVDHSWMAGYWGRTFSNGNEQLSDWQPQNLVPNDEVGFLVTTEGECVVFVNGAERCRFGDPHVPVRPGEWATEPELTALIDVAPGSSVEFLRGEPPQRSAVARRTSGGKQIIAPASGQSGEAGQAPIANSGPSSIGEVHPPPPPPSPTRLTTPQCRSPPSGVSHHGKHGGTSSPPVPPLIQLRQGHSHQAAWSTSTSVVQARVLSDNRGARAIPARRVPQLPLPLK